ncbi:MAG TPA: EAL domain-containing protein [Pyrinomonadaceae bacterium]|nr:EAL domain-containing protein [Pyrinomonadaceae bacterium]
MKPTLLIIDDEPAIRTLLESFLEERYDCVTAGNAAEARAAIAEQYFNVVLSDIDLGGETGTELVPSIIEASPETAVVMISGNRDLDDAIASIRAGAFDYVKKPFELDFLEMAVDRALQHNQLLRSKRQYETELEHLLKKRTDQVTYLSLHDSVTGLPNSVRFRETLARELETGPSEELIGVMLITIESYRKLQETFGHATASDALKEIGRRLVECVNPRSTVARIDGEEFAVLIPGIRDRDELAEMADCALGHIREPLFIGEDEVFLSASIGMSIAPTDSSDAAKLIENASSALLNAREQGGDRSQFYMNGMNRAARRRLSIENGLRRALDRNEMRVVYQPKAECQTGKIVGMEALVRWENDEFGPISPAEFVPIAESTGAIVQIGEWVLDQAAEFGGDLTDLGYDLLVSVNLSERQLREAGFQQMVMDILAENELPAERLDLEITESLLMTDREIAVQALSELRMQGISISIDDFGTGYSSLGRLKSLPLDALKIDRSFITDVTTDPNSASLVLALVTLAHNLGLKVIAEGVETEEQLKFLKLIRCDEYQGYLLSKPVPRSEFLELVKRRSGGSQGIPAADHLCLAA